MDPTDALALKTLLEKQPVAALATLHDGEPAVSMVPFAMLPGGRAFVIHVSRLATHTNDMLAVPAVGLLVTASLDAAQTPLALPRAGIQGRAHRCEAESSAYREAREVYLAKLPEAEELFGFPDFSLFMIEPRTVRYVAGFGRALSLNREQVAEILEGAA